MSDQAPSWDVDSCLTQVGRGECVLGSRREGEMAAGAEGGGGEAMAEGEGAVRGVFLGQGFGLLQAALKWTFCLPCQP